MRPMDMFGGSMNFGSHPEPRTPETINNAPQFDHRASMAFPMSFKHGGKVEKTGIALVHKGETVIPAEEGEMKNHSLHRALAHLNKGGLHRALHVPEGQKIPEDKLEKARNSSNPHVAHMANFAHTMSGWKK